MMVLIVLGLQVDLAVDAVDASKAYDLDG